jgi:hypothetical protein
MSTQANTPDTPSSETEVERRRFLERVGKYAAVTPPVITMMLTASTVPAYAKGSGHLNAGEGNGNEGGDPGNSGSHNQVGNNNANPNSSAAQNEPEIDDPNEPN